jgi:hypothetical protein
LGDIAAEQSHCRSDFPQGDLGDYSTAYPIYGRIAPPSRQNPQFELLRETPFTLIFKLEVGRERETREMSMSLAKPFHLLAVSAAFLFVAAIVLGAI